MRHQKSRDLIRAANVAGIPSIIGTQWCAAS